jgi:hypothetical protein
VRLLDELDVELPGRPPTRAGLALAGEPELGAGTDARRDLHRETASRADAPVAATVCARVGDDRAEPLAGRAGASRHHLTEERPGDLLHLAASLADVAAAQRGAGGGTFAVAGSAGHGRVDLDVARRAERRLGEVDLEPDHRVAPGPLARTWAALRSGATEEGVHDVGEPETLAESATGGERVRAEVVQLTLLRVGEHFVGLGDLFEALFLVRVDVRVQLAGKSPVSLFDLVGCRVALDAEHLVVVSRHYDSATILPT